MITECPCFYLFCSQQRVPMTVWSHSKCALFSLRPPLLIRRGRFSDEDATRMWAQLSGSPSRPVASTSQPLHPICAPIYSSSPRSLWDPLLQPWSPPPPPPRPSLKTFRPAPRRLSALSFPPSEEEGSEGTKREEGFMRIRIAAEWTEPFCNPITRGKNDHWRGGF